MMCGVKIERTVSQEDQWWDFAQQAYHIYAMLMKAGFKSNQAMELTNIIVRESCN